MFGLSKKDKLKKTFNVAAEMERGLDALKSERGSKLQYTKTEKADGSFTFDLNIKFAEDVISPENRLVKEFFPFSLRVTDGIVQCADSLYMNGAKGEKPSTALERIEDIARDTGILPVKSKYSPIDWNG